MEFLRNLFPKNKKKWLLLLLVFFGRLFEDRLHGFINKQIDLQGKQIMVFIEKLFNIPLGIGGMAVIFILIIIIIKTYLETRPTNQIKIIDELQLKSSLKIEYDENDSKYFYTNIHEGLTSEASMVERCFIGLLNNGEMALHDVRVELNSIEPPPTGSNLNFPITLRFNEENENTKKITLSKNEPKLIHVISISETEWPVSHEIIIEQATKNKKPTLWVKENEPHILDIAVYAEELKDPVIKRFIIEKVKFQFVEKKDEQYMIGRKLRMTEVSLQEEKSDFKIRIHGIGTSAFTETKKNKSIHKRLVIMNITFIPNKIMKFKKLYLSIDDVRFESWEGFKDSTLKLPINIKGQETHVVYFQFESYFLPDDRKGVIQLIALADGQEWKSENIIRQLIPDTPY